MWESWNSWSEVYDLTLYHKAWPYPQAYGTNKYWSMYNQFVCYADWPGGFKTPWNIEPSTKDKGYWRFVENWCN
jgi:hypothetical protein